MTHETSTNEHSTTELTLGRASAFWRLVPLKYRFRLLTWWARRAVGTHQQAMLRDWRRQFALMTPANCTRVVHILRTSWDPTGVRLLGVPESDFLVYAEQLLTTLSITHSDPASDAALAEQLATFESGLGLRDSPTSHRVSVAAAIRTAIVARSK